MSDQVEKYRVNNILLSDNKPTIKHEKCEESDSVENKIQDIKTEFLSCKMDDDNIANYNVKIEKEIIADNIKMEFESGLYCEHCHIYYEGYCIKCGMLVHILNKNTPNDTIKAEGVGLPDDILEIQNYLGRFGIFALKVIPEGVKFGPFTGFSNREYLWKNKGGEFVANKDESRYLNWMKYINPARSPFEQNLLAFQCDNNLYYQSICEIQVGDELLVHFGEEYKDSINKDQAVFACTFCCLGFSSVSNLVKHKTVCSNNVDGRFPDEELTQCSSCKIYLYQKEYFKHHMIYCSESNIRKCVQLPIGNQTTEITGPKIQRRRIYKCVQCKYKTKYKGDLKNHTKQHYKVKMYKCGFCYRRFMTRDSLVQHAGISHAIVCKEDLERAVNAHVKEEHPLSQGQTKRFKCPLCEFRTTYKRGIKRHIKTRHLKEFDHKCESCDYKTNQKTHLEMHIKSKHLVEFDYKCEACDYKTNHKSQLEMHIKASHFNEFDYKCELCDYKTNHKSNFEKHIKSNHLKEFDYKCESCDYKTNNKSNFDIHRKRKHLVEFDHKCDSCDYKTNNKSNLDMHTKTKHLVEFDYKCELCHYKTNNNSNFKKHVKASHLKEVGYKCDSCHYETNYKSHLDMHIRTKHLKEFNYKCESCRYESNQKSNFEKHVKSKHLKEFDYKCKSCDYKTNFKSDFEKHMKTKHLVEFDYTCDSCDYKTNDKPMFEKHMKSKHLRKYDYKCDSCDYKTNQKTHFEIHIKSKHLVEFDYKCEFCHYNTNRKSDFKKHVKRKHPK